MHTVFARRSFGITFATVVAVAAAVVAITTVWSRAHSATITASYESGYLDVSINGYGATGMGTFRLDDAGDGHLALCVEADEHHSTEADAYSPVENRIVSPELDALIWLVSAMPSVDADTGIAAAALAWYYSGAQRNIGVPVWADGHRGFAPINPVDPERWDALAPYSSSHLIGLRGGGAELDQAERRVVELHDASARLAGPWALTAEQGRFRLSGRSGSIAGQTITVVVRDHTGSTSSTTDLISDADGWVSPAVPAMPAGGSVSASASSPGVHREWDGQGDVQRLVTATAATLTAEWRVSPQPGHLLVMKRSTDPTIAVGGAVFALLDGNGTEVERVTSESNGEARFAPVDTAIHTGPFTVHEVSAPAGLRVTAPDQTLPTLSSDPAAPTVLIMTDAPRTVPVRVRKRLSIDGVGPPDRSGFEFDVTRAGDGLTFRLITDRTGESQPLELAIGDYNICERAVPTWAAALVDGGCVRISITLDVIDRYDEVIAVDPTQRPAFPIEYLNGVVVPSIRTTAHDAADGDRTISSGGGRVIDVVTLSGLIPGTSYTITGELVPPGGTPSDTTGESWPPRADGSAVWAMVEFVASASNETHEVGFDVPPLAAGRLAAGRHVIVERLWVDGELVAEHADLTDELQTIDIAAPTTTTTTIAPTTTTTTTTTIAPTTLPPTTLPPTTLPPATTIPATTAPTTAPPTTSPMPPVTTLPSVTPLLPTTGSPGVGQLLRIGDVVLLIGVGLLVMTRVIPRRPTDR